VELGREDRERRRREEARKDSSQKRCDVHNHAEW
jgi:hypothetical protein